MRLTVRSYKDEADYWQIRAFLREVMILNDLREFSWHVARLDYWRWHGLLNCQEIDSLEGLIYIWETSGGHIKAVLNPEGKGDAYLQMHPEFRTEALETEMINLAEEKLAVNSDDQQVLTIWANPEDSLRIDILKQRGYTPGKWIECQWRRNLDEAIPEVPIPDGYIIRSLGDMAEIPARSWASWRGFHPEGPDDDYEGWDWYLNIQRCPLYRRDLDIVAVAPTGEIASFCTMWYDDVTRTAYIEPVATVPEHLRRGLARAPR